jgi:hypothetical protein
MGFIRPFTPDDIPLVSDLYARSFHREGKSIPNVLETYLHEIYFANPWYDASFPSLVYQDDRTHISGFLGVMPRRMTLHGQPIRAVIGSQLMVEPGNRTSMAGLYLVETFFAGPQDLSLIDGATDAYRKIHEAIGGITALLYSFDWSQAVQPLRAVPPLAAEALSETMLLACLSDYAPDYVLRPEYDAHSLRWLLQLVAQGQHNGALQQIVLRDAERQVVGWYLYGLHPGGVGEVLQVGAVKPAIGEVLEHLFYHAGKHGATSLRGRIDPMLRPVLSEKKCQFHRGHWMLAYAKSPELLRAIQDGKALLTRLDGEWCLRAP